MKKLILRLSAAAVLNLVAVTLNPVLGQVPTQTTTVTSTGTVSEFTPNAMAVRINTSPVPVHYTFTKTTTYVDENGNPISVETVKSGVPVVVYYEKNGDNLVADKVVVKKSVTTTTDSSDSTLVSQPTPPSADGIIADADSDSISLRSMTSASPVHYKAHDATAYVDESGNPVSRDTLRSGTPVTIYYERDEDSLLATRVVVKNSPVVEKTTTTEETTVPR